MRRRMVKRVVVALGLVAPFARPAAAAAPPDEIERPWLRPAPFSAGAVFDESGPRFGVDTRLRWMPGGDALRTDVPGAARHAAPFALEGRAHVSNWRSGERPALGTAALLNAGDDLRRVWLGIAALDGHAPDATSGRWSLGAGVLQAMGGVTVHADAYAMRGHVAGDLYRLQLQVPGIPDSTYPGPLQRHPARDPLWTTSRVSVHWQRGPGSVEAAGGVTVGDLIRPRRWARLLGRLQVTSGIAMDLSFGQRPPAEAAFDPTLAPGTAVALTWAPARHAPSVVPPAPLVARGWQLAAIDPGRFAVHLRCPQARRVALRGDFSDWDAVPMRSVGSGWWECVAPFAAGLQKVQVSIDGGPWSAPEGLPLQRDGDRVSGTILVTERPRMDGS